MIHEGITKGIPPSLRVAELLGLVPYIHIYIHTSKFIKHKKLRSVMQGPGYRERQSVNSKRFMTDFKVSLDDCVNKWASSEQQDVSCLNEWKAKVIHDVQAAIKRLHKKRRYNQKRKTMILKSPKVMSELAELQKMYAFVPSANNIAIVCKRFHVDKTMKELNIFFDDKILPILIERVMKALMQLSNVISDT